MLPKPFSCSTASEMLWHCERGGPFHLRGEEPCTVASNSLKRKVTVAWSKKGDFLVNDDVSLQNE